MNGNYTAMQSSNTNMEDSNYKMNQLHAQTLNKRIEQFKRPKFQNLEAKSEILIELTKLQLDTVNDQSRVIEGLTKNLKETNIRGVETGVELDKLKICNESDNRKLYCYGFALLCVLVVMVLLNWLIST